jgi:hydrogenase nickel incorporation protein HypB
VVAVNFMSAPGAGKTSVLEKTLPALKDDCEIAVIEGDLYTTLDSDRMHSAGIPAYQITTGTCCHLDARMVTRALDEFPLGDTRLLVIENVGNMVCPAEFDLGEDFRVMVYSAVEGAEKPQKYPLMFQTAGAILLNKIDLIPYAGVSLEELTANVRKVNPKAPVFPISCRTGEGIPPWISWFRKLVLGLE